MKISFIRIIPAVLLAGIFGIQCSVAQVFMDGTIGAVGEIRGPNYDIMAKYGKQEGGNLFHSFSEFTVNTGEVANFGVPPSIENIISRVTGGSASRIDGTLRSTLTGTSDISGANLYLMNPYGVMFGPNASLDIGGSFHATTADYLRMGDKERFYAIQYNEVLSSAPPSAFGFLDSDAAPISAEGGTVKIHKETWDNQWEDDPPGLRVREGKTISLTGGEIKIKNTHYELYSSNYDEDGNPVYEDTYKEGDEFPVKIGAPGGRIHLTGVASPGEAVVSESGTDVSSFENLEKITLSGSFSEEAVNISVSGEGSGDIFIRAGQLFADSGAVAEADTLGDEDGGITDIQADTISLSQGSNIFSDTRGSGKGGSINISGRDGDFADAVSISDSSRIFADTTGKDVDSGDAGAVFIRTTNLSLSELGRISSETEGTGAGGDVTLQVAESVSVSGTSRIYGGSKMDASDAGPGGNILIEAKNISFTDGGNILSESMGGGKGGDVSIFAESVRFSSQDGAEYPSKVYTSTHSTEAYAGDAGNIFIKADDISFNDNGGITASTHGPGNAGTITLDTGRLDLDTGASVSSASESEGRGGNAGVIDIRAEDSVSMNNGSSITTATSGGGHAGDIMLETGHFDIRSGSLVSSASTSKYNGGDAGTVFIRADNLVRLSENSSITTLAEDAGKGKITVVAGDRIYVWDSEIATSIKKGGNDAGDITMDQDILVLNRSRVVANAWEGRGGNIRLIAEPFAQSWESVVDASSMFGIDGTVYIESPQGNFASMVLLPANPLDATRWIKTPCAARSGEDISRFVIKGRDARPATPDDLQPGKCLWFND